MNEFVGLVLATLTLWVVVFGAPILARGMFLIPFTWRWATSAERVVVAAGRSPSSRARFLYIWAVSTARFVVAEFERGFALGLSSSILIPLCVFGAWFGGAVPGLALGHASAGGIILAALASAVSDAQPWMGVPDEVVMAMMEGEGS